MQEGTIFRLQIEGLKHHIQHQFNNVNDEFVKAIANEIDRTLTLEWVEKEIERAVEQTVRLCISKLTDNWNLQHAITNAIADKISASIRENNNECPNKN